MIFKINEIKNENKIRKEKFIKIIMKFLLFQIEIHQTKKYLKIYFFIKEIN